MQKCRAQCALRAVCRTGAHACPPLTAAGAARAGTWALRACTRPRPPAWWRRAWCCAATCCMPAAARSGARGSRGAAGRVPAAAGRHAGPRLGSCLRGRQKDRLPPRPTHAQHPGAAGAGHARHAPLWRRQRADAGDLRVRAHRWVLGASSGGRQADVVAGSSVFRVRTPTLHCTHLLLTLQCCQSLPTHPNPPDVEYEDNLRYFLQMGVRPGDGCDYLLVVQEVRPGLWCWDSLRLAQRSRRCSGRVQAGGQATGG